MDTSAVIVIMDFLRDLSTTEGGKRVNEAQQPESSNEGNKHWNCGYFKQISFFICFFFFFPNCTITNDDL